MHVLAVVGDQPMAARGGGPITPVVGMARQAGGGPADRRAFESAGLALAVREAGVQRFRPILLSSLTTFFGLAPLMWNRSFDAAFMVPMAVSLGFGVLFATFITLILVPTSYMILDDLRRAARGMFGQRQPAEAKLRDREEHPGLDHGVRFTPGGTPWTQPGGDRGADQVE